MFTDKGRMNLQEQLNITMTDMEQLERRAGVYMCTQVVDILETIGQTYVLIAISSDIQITKSIIKAGGFNRAVFGFVFQALAVENLMFWLNSSFIDFGIIQNIPWNIAVYGKSIWPGLAQFTLPLALFFRFHSVHIILEVFIEAWVGDSAPSKSTTASEQKKTRNTPI